MSAAIVLMAPQAFANPQDGTVSAGSATIQNQGTTTTITQSSDRAVIDWRKFDIEANETTRFLQPGSGSITVNRVRDTDPSHIFGTLTANGNIVIINPNGVVFGANSRVDVNGLVATTADIDNQKFMSGSLSFDKPGNPDASIINYGTITAKDAGLVGLVAPNVINSGVITANVGRVQLSSGDTATVDFYGDHLMEVAVSDDVKHQMVSNTGTITAAGGTIVMSAATGRNVIDSLVSAKGELKAPTISAKGGAIYIGGAQSSGAKVTVQAHVDAAGHNTGERGGKIQVTGRNITVAKNSVVDASGKAGGGTIRIGGGYQGGEGIERAQSTLIEDGTFLNARADDTGNGGSIVVWSDVGTKYMGALSVRGGDISGNGGSAEVSSKGTLDFTGGVDLGAAHGAAGSLLLDPENVTIQTSSVSPLVSCSNGVCIPVSDDSILTVAALQAALASGNVTVTTGSTGTQADGNITVANDITWSNGSLLTLAASGNVRINSGVTIRNTYAGTTFGAGALPVVLALRADSGSVNGNTTAANLSYGVVNNGTIDLSTSTGAASIFYDWNGQYVAGTQLTNSAWTAPANYSVSSQFTGYRLVNSLSDLTAIASNLSYTYALGKTLDGGGTTAFNGTAGNFLGILDGQYCALTGVANCGVINYTQLRTAANAGLFNSLQAGAIARNLNVNLAITQNYNGTSNVNAGIVAGQNLGTIANVNASGSITLNDTITGSTAASRFLGGLAGLQGGSGNTGISYNAKSSAQVQYIYGGTASAVITMYEGGLIGLDTSVQANNINQSSASGAVSASYNLTGCSGSACTGSLITGIGGLVGNVNSASVSIANSFATGDVSSTLTGSTENIGGFAGLNVGTITGSYATGKVTYTAANAGILGGFAGSNSGTITQSYARGAVTMNNATSGATGNSSSLGGLSGNNTGTIGTSYATGAVTYNQTGAMTGLNTVGIGGLVGSNTSILATSISNSYATGNVTTQYGGGGSGPAVIYEGGLVGIHGSSTNATALSGSYAAGNVTSSVNSTSNVWLGGLVGWERGLASITDSYAMGRVSYLSGSASANLASLVAWTNGTIANSYATGYVNYTGSGTGTLGGVTTIVTGTGSGVTNSYWNTDTTGLSTSAGGTGAVGKTTAQLQGGLQTGLSNSTWSIVAGSTYPFLTWQAPSGTVRVVSGTAYSDRGSTAAAGVDVGLLVNGNANGSLLGPTQSSGANGYYYFLLAPNTISSSGSDVLTYYTGATKGNTLYSGATGNVTSLSMYGNTLRLTAAAGTPSGLANSLTNALGANTGSNFLGTGSSVAGINKITTTNGDIALSSNVTWNTGDEFVLSAAGSVYMMSGATVRNTYTGNTFAAGAAPVVFAVRADNLNLNGYATAAGTSKGFVNGGTIDLSSSSGVASIFYDWNGTYTAGTQTANSGWVVPDNYSVSSQFTAYRLINSLADFYAIATNPTTKSLTYAFGTNLDGGGGAFNSNTSLGNFSGIIDGQYCAIIGGSNCSMSNLTFTSSASYGTGIFNNLYGYARNFNLGLSVTNTATSTSVVGSLAGVNFGGTIANVNATGSVTANAATTVTYVGGLVGFNDGDTAVSKIINSSFSGSVSGGQTAGGLVGINRAYTGGAIISGSSTSGTVTATNSAAYAAGLVGNNEGGAISNSRSSSTITGANYIAGLVAVNTGTAYTSSILNSYATGAVTATTGNAGGLIAKNSGQYASITGSYATGAVSGSTSTGTNIGGLVGWNVGTITGSYATGAATGHHYIAGLVGVSESSISNSYATGLVTADSLSGGLVGHNTGSIATSFATGNVVGGTSYNGGLVGFNDGDTYVATITDSYATGAVSGTGSIGGLVGLNRKTSGTASIANSYSTGKVTGSSSVGGLVGANAGGGTVTNSYWDTGTSGQASSSGGTGLTTAQLQSDFQTGFANPVWRIVTGVTYPYLNWQAGDGAQVVAGNAYVTPGGAALSTGNIGLLINGSSPSLLGSTVSLGANGYYYFLLTPGAISSSGTSFLTYLTGATKGNTLYDSATDSVTNVAVNGNYLRFLSPSSTSPWSLVSAYNTSLGSNTGSNFLGTATASNGIYTLSSSAYLGIASNIRWDTGDALVLSAANTVTMGGVIIRNRYTGSTFAEGSPIVLVIRGDSAGVNGSGTAAGSSYGFSNGGTLDFSGSTGAVAFFQDWNASAPAGTFQTNSGWTAPANASISTQFTTYKLINSLADLAAVNGSSTTLGYTYALGKTLDGGGTAFNSNASMGTFTGILDGQYCALIGGLNCGITNITQTIASGSSNAGLFGTNAGTIRNLQLNTTVSDTYTGATGGPGVGGLAASSTGVIANVSMTGSVTLIYAGSTSANTTLSLGGLVGTLSGTGTIANSSTNAIVSYVYKGTATGQLYLEVGGLAGYTPSTAAISVTNSTSAGQVKADNFTGYSGNHGGNIGGLVGYLPNGTITNSSSSASVSGNLTGYSVNFGGLVGYNTATLKGTGGSYAFATGNVSTTSTTSASIGGLVGANGTGGSIDMAYATGNVTFSGAGGANVGGLTGSNSATITNAYTRLGTVQATTAVTGSSTSTVSIGGAIGVNNNAAVANNVSSSDAVQYIYGGTSTGTSTAYVGGVIGNMGSGTFSGLAGSGVVTAGYGTGITGNINGYVGGVVGQDVGTSIINNSSSAASVTDTLAGGNTYVGGFIGNNYGTLQGTGSQYTSSTANVIYTGAAAGGVGGLVGYNNGGTITQTSSQYGNVTGTLTATGSTTPSMFLGGLSGNNSINGGTITNSTSSDTVSFQYAGTTTGTSTIYVGGLLGFNGNATTTGVSGSSASGNVSAQYASGFTGNINGYLGGLVAINGSGSAAVITNSSATGNVSSTLTGGNEYIGGLVGYNSGGTVQGTGSLYSYATGNVNYTGTGSVSAGGLVGYVSNGAITQTYASGGAVNVTTTTSGTASPIINAGGLAGAVVGTAVVSNSTAADNVNYTYQGTTTGTPTVITGGLVANVTSTAPIAISNSGATGNVTAQYASGFTGNVTNYSGGLIGAQSNSTNIVSISGTFATGNVSGSLNGGNEHLGGLVGNLNDPNATMAITDSYALGSVVYTGTSGTRQIGGLIGQATGNVTTSYAAGYVSGASGTVTGGLTGSGGTFTSSYWDTDTTGQATSSGSGGIGKTTVQLQAALPTGFSSTVWGNLAGISYPYLKWQAPSGVQVYSGRAFADGNNIKTPTTALVGVAVATQTGNGAMLSSLNGNNGVVTTGANGYWYYLLAPNTIPTNTSLLSYLTGTTKANLFKDKLDGGSVYNQTLYANTAYFSSQYSNSATTLSALSADVAAAMGKTNASNFLFSVSNGAMTGNANMMLSIASGTTFNIDKALSSSGTTGDIALQSDGTVTQTAAITAPYLEVRSNGGTTGVFMLDSVANNVANLGSTSSGVATLAFDNGANNFNINELSLVGGIYAKNVWLKTTGTVSNGHTLSATNSLVLTGNGAIYNLTTGPSNSFKTVAIDVGSTGRVYLVDKVSDTITIGSANGVNGVNAGTFVLINDGGTVNQTQGITAANLDLMGTGATFNLSGPGNTVGMLAVNVTTGTATFNNGSNNLVIGAVNGTNGVTAGTFNLSSSGTVTQTQGIVASAMSLLGSGGVFTLTGTGNNVAALAANIGSTGVLSLNNGANALSIGVAGGATSINGLFGISSAGTVNLQSTGTISQGNSIVASNLSLSGNGGVFNLSNGAGGNDVGTIAGNAGTGSIVYNEGGDYVVGSVNGIDGLTAASVELTTTGTVTETKGITGKLLLRGVSGVYNLTGATNAVSILASGPSGVDTVSLNNGATNLSIGTVNGASGIIATNLNLTDTGTVTQANSIRATTMSLAGNGGIFTLTNAGGSNNVGTLAANVGTGTVTYNNGANALAIGTANGIDGITAGTLNLNNTGSVTQTKAITATNVSLAGTGGVYTLTNTGNAIGTIAVSLGTGGTGGTLDLNNGANNLVFGTVNGINGARAQNMYVTDTGSVSQTQLFIVGNLLLSGNGSNYNFNSVGSNSITTLAANIGTGSLSFNNGSHSFGIGAVNGVNGITANSVIIADVGTVSETQGITANTLLLTGSGGIFNLSSTNTIGTLATNIGTGSVTLNNGATNLLVGGVSGVSGINAGTANLISTGTVTQSKLLNVTNLSLAGSGATYTLTNTSNAIGTLAADVGNTGTINLYDGANNLNIGSVNSINGVTAGNFYLNDTATVTQSQAIAAAKVALQGSGATFTLSNTGNSIGMLAANLGSGTVALNNGANNLVIGTVNGINGVNADTLALTDTGAVTQTRELYLSNLALKGAGGTYVLNNANNVIDTIAGDTGSISLYNSDSLSTGTIAGISGVNVTGNVSLIADGAASDLTIASGAGITAGSSGNAIILSSGQNFINNAGSTALTASSGRWLVYSTQASGNTPGGLAENFHRYSCTLAGTCPSMPANGNGMLYSYTPMLTVTPTALGVTYGDGVTLAGYGYGVSGYLSGESADTLSGSLNGISAYLQGSNVGSYDISYDNGSLISALGYGFIYNNNANAITVAQKNISAAFAGQISKTAGEFNPTLSYANFIFSTLVNGDSANLFTSVTPHYGTITETSGAGIYTFNASIADTLNYHVVNTPVGSMQILLRPIVRPMSDTIPGSVLSASQSGSPDTTSTNGTTSPSDTQSEYVPANGTNQTINPAAQPFGGLLEIDPKLDATISAGWLKTSAN